MKKRFTRIMLVLSIAVLSLSMVFALAGCGKKDGAAYAEALEKWNAAQDKSVKDSFTLTGKMNAGNFKNLELTMVASLERAYKGGELDKVEFKVEKVDIKGVEGLIDFVKENFLKGNTKVLGIINDLMPDGKTVSLKDIATATITKKDDIYYADYTLKVGDILTLPDPKTWKSKKLGKMDQLNDLLKGFGITFDLNRAVAYDLNQEKIDKNAIKVNPVDALNYIIGQIFDSGKVVDKLFADAATKEGYITPIKDEEDKNKTVNIDQTMQDKIAAYIGISKLGGKEIKDFALEIVDFKDATLKFDYEKNSFKTINGNQKININIESQKILDLINFNVGGSPAGQLLTEIQKLFTYKPGDYKKVSVKNEKGDKVEIQVLTKGKDADYVYTINDAVVNPWAICQAITSNVALAGSIFQGNGITAEFDLTFVSTYTIND